MPPPVFLLPSDLDIGKIVADREAIERMLPHRHEFQLLDAVLMIDVERGLFAGYHDVRPDAFWCRGHIPGRPLLPGVLMLEIGAQLCSYVYLTQFAGAGRFLGFTGLDEVKFRGAVAPPARLVVTGKPVQMSLRRLICQTQGFVDDEMVFEAKITGMPI